MAYLGVLCSTSFGYGVSEVRSNSQIAALIVAHEMGHNFGAPHDGADACAAQTGTWIMNPSISTAATQFSPCSVTQMSDDVNAATCLVPLATALFRNGFE